MFTDRKDLSVKDSYHKKPSQRQCNLHWKNRDMLHKTKKKKNLRFIQKHKGPNNLEWKGQSWRVHGTWFQDTPLINS